MLFSRTYNECYAARLACLVSLVMLLFSAANAQAQTDRVFTPDNLPKVHVQDHSRYVCNPAGILSQSTVAEIDRTLYALERQTGIETVVAVVPSIGDASCFDFCHELMNNWGVGKKGKDNGLVVLLVIDQRCIQFYTGYGLEGILPDAICKRIQTRDMIPALKNENWDKAMLDGMLSVAGILDGSMQNDTGTEDGSPLEIAVLMFVLAAFVLSLLTYAAYEQTKCPACGKHKLKRIDSQLLYRRNGIRVSEITYVCENCGHTLKRKEKIYESNGSNHRGGGPVIFSGGSFGGGMGGGSFGGSFGGGMGGGGGAGSRF